jgi:hypothetical protein
MLPVDLGCLRQVQCRSFLLPRAFCQTFRAPTIGYGMGVFLRGDFEPSIRKVGEGTAGRNAVWQGRRDRFRELHLAVCCAAVQVWPVG